MFCHDFIVASSVFHATVLWFTLDSSRGLIGTIVWVLPCQVRHFALHSLERMLKLRWRPVHDAKSKNGSKNGAENAAAEPALKPGDPPPLSLAEKEQLKECMIQVMARGTRDVAQEAQFIKIKVTTIFCSHVLCRVEPWEFSVESRYRYCAVGLIEGGAVGDGVPCRCTAYQSNHVYHPQVIVFMLFVASAQHD